MTTWFFYICKTQGDGEFCVTALETSMHGRFRLTVLKAAASGAERGADEGSSTLASSTERSMFHPRSALTTPRATTSSHSSSPAQFWQNCFTCIVDISRMSSSTSQ